MNLPDSIEVPSAACWTAVCAWLDGCPPEAIDEAVAEVRRRTEGWGGTRSTFVYDEVKTPDLRMAPPAWVDALLRGEDSPKFGVVRGLDLFRRKLNAKQLEAVLASSHLGALTLLDLGQNYKVPVRPLRALGARRDLTHLGLMHLTLTEKHVDALLASDGLSSVVHLNLNCTKVERPEDTRRLLLSPLARGLEELFLRAYSLNTRGRVGVIDALLEQGQLGGLRRLNLRQVGDLGRHNVRDLLGVDFPRLHDLCLYGTHVGPEVVDALLSARWLSGLRRLDLGEIQGLRPDDVARLLLDGPVEDLVWLGLRGDIRPFDVQTTHAIVHASRVDPDRKRHALALLAGSDSLAPPLP